MSRIARKDIDTPFLHLMIQGINKEYIFNDKKYIENYLAILKKYTNEYNITIIAYCIMNNHAHFLVYVEDIEQLGRAMHKINCLYVQMYNKMKNRVGVLFRNRYRLEPIYNVKYLVNCINYIHNNPVKAKMVNKCEEYEYSSYRDYLFNTGVTQSNIMKELFGKEYDYISLFKNSFEKRFMDLENETDVEKRKYIIEGICEFKKNYCKNIWEIFSNKDKLIRLISFLKEECGISYVDTRNFFEMSRGTIDKLKIRKD